MVVGTMPSQTARNNSNGNIADTFWCKYILSVVAATVAELATYPLDLTKTRLQVQGERGLNGKNNVHRRGMVGTAVGIIREEGVLRLWQGITPAIYRHLIYTGIRMETYEQLREKVLKKSPDGSYSIWKSAIGGLTAGAVGQLAASPADLVKVQLQMEGRRRLEGKEPRATGTHQAFKKILKEGGVKGLWKGWAPNVQRAALVNLGDLTTYDTAKQLILANTNLKDDHFTHTLSSGCAGLVAATMGTPADVVKTRVMNQPTDKHGRGMLYRSSVDCLMKTINQEGFWALYKGFLPTWIRMAPWSLTFWLSFEHIRRLVGAASF